MDTCPEQCQVSTPADSSGSGKQFRGGSNGQGHLDQDEAPAVRGGQGHRPATRSAKPRVVGDLTRTGLPEASADAIVCIDAFHFATDLAAAASEARRILRPGRRLVLTNWQPNVPADTRLPSRRRIDWFRLLRGAGFAHVETETRPEWQDVWTRVYRVALDLGDPGQDIALADLQDEARKHLPLADLLHRVALTATTPER
jgi:SAM-dependent methyltransferase